ncbi:hypothetical protein A3C86_03175 [Candidatus Kaiserbacteria bacterium RIFCSPHIGHO2_02_FULL_49_16]|uniref:Uncharacterized protein n=1 Tax=Candidatus Kaiserbacteria bacterium RIFCSPHIGHO2_02_FULL_49_16 TaxID=1798490 RepID=A0A1F6DF46_9BACT|nr:MAG: hypothetical protein A3C86_03175 [Candidatus Kaiserbacteria bacterium RIFCSPHIGHO2_02_FULL_49_16]
MTGITSVILACAIVAIPAFVFAAPAARTYGELIDKLVSIIAMGSIVLVVLAFVGYFYGISTNILKFGEENSAEKRTAFFFWGIIILFVMLSWLGILRLLGNTFLIPQDTQNQQQQLAPGQRSA